jgi:hypothetical protein
VNAAPAEMASVKTANRIRRRRELAGTVVLSVRVVLELRAGIDWNS